MEASAGNIIIPQPVNTSASRFLPCAGNGVGGLLPYNTAMAADCGGNDFKET